MLVGDVEVEDHLDVAGVLQGLDRLAHRQILAQGEDLGGHDAAGGVLPVLQQLLDLLRLLRLHQAENLRRQLLWQVLHDVGGVVPRHVLQQFEDLLLVELRQQAGADGVIEFGQHVAGDLRIVDQPKEQRLLLVVEVTKEMGDVGRVNLAQQPGQVGIGPAAQQPPGGFEETLKFLFHGKTSPSGFAGVPAAAGGGQAAEFNTTSGGLSIGLSTFGRLPADRRQRLPVAGRAALPL